MAMLDVLLQRSVIVTLAMLGAVLVMLGNYLRQKNTKPTVSNKLTLLGYAVTAISVLLFIVAGFRSAYV